LRRHNISTIFSTVAVPDYLLLFSTRSTFLSKHLRNTSSSKTKLLNSTKNICCILQVRTQRRLADLDAALAAVDAAESAELAAIDEAGSRRQADAVHPPRVLDTWPLCRGSGSTC